MPNETHKPKEVTLRSSPAARDPVGTDTVPDLGLPVRLGVSTDTLPEQAGVYVPPRPLASASDHRTIEIAPVRLALDIDPRRAPTELRLSAPPPRKQSAPVVLVLSALLVLAVAGFFLARLVVTPSEPSAVIPSEPLPVLELPAPPPIPVATSEAFTPAAPPPVVEAPEPPLVPVTPAELGLRPRAPSPSTAPAQQSPEPAKKKVREPWLE